MTFEVFIMVVIGIIMWNICAYIRHNMQLKKELEATGRWSKKFIKELMKAMPKYMADLQKVLEDM